MIFVDNGSTDGSRQLVEQEYPEVQVVALPENLGFCRAVNRGIRASRTPYVVLLNNDTEADPRISGGAPFGDSVPRKAGPFPARPGCCSFRIREDRIDDAGNFYNAMRLGLCQGQGESRHGPL